MSEYFLETRNIDKSFFGVKVLDNISFNLKPGEIHTIVGKNGAGKSTLMKTIMGIYNRDARKVYLNGKEVIFQTPKDALDNGILIIQQELSPIMDMEVAEYIFSGREICKNSFGDLSSLISKYKNA